MNRRRMIPEMLRQAPTLLLKKLMVIIKQLTVNFKYNLMDSLHSFF